MRRLRRALLGIALSALILGAFLAFWPALFWRPLHSETVVEAAFAQADFTRGLYIAQLAGCHSCHDGEAGALTGGLAFETDFGTLYAPNISAAATANWSLQDFNRAMTAGLKPLNGQHLYPAFPYGHYRGMSPQDLADLWLYLSESEAIESQVEPNNLVFPISIRGSLAGWRVLFGGRDVPAESFEDPQIARGAYLMNNLLHCSACHTPRGALGQSRISLFMRGDPGFPGRPAPDISMSALGDWSDAELEDVLRTGFTPEFDLVAAQMEEVVQNSSQHLSEEDMAALIAYWRTID